MQEAARMAIERLTARMNRTEPESRKTMLAARRKIRLANRVKEDLVICSPAFNQRNFASVDYLDGKGER